MTVVQNSATLSEKGRPGTGSSPKTAGRQSVNDNVSMIADRINITNKFNVFFTNIGEKMAKGINYDGNKNYGNYLSFTFMNIDEAIYIK